MLSGSKEALCEVYDLAMLDLDGVVYIGASAVPGAPEHLSAVRERGMRCAFVTNNASRTPEKVAAKLNAMGVEAAAEDVVTSAQAAASLLSHRLEPGANVVMLGTSGLDEALRAAGLVPVGVEDEAAAIVSGYGPDVLWRDVMRAAVRIRDGLWWVASNADLTIPTGYGVAPGHGVLVETLQRFSGVAPLVAGKPQRPLLEETIRRVGGKRPLMIGDRLDTDIEGAVAAGIDALLVMTGVTDLGELVAAAPEQRPTYVGQDLRELFRPQPTPTFGEAVAELGGWRAQVRDDDLHVEGDGDRSDWWRIVATAAWAHLDATGRVVTFGTLTPPVAPNV